MRHSVDPLFPERPDGWAWSAGERAAIESYGKACAERAVAHYIAAKEVPTRWSSAVADAAQSARDEAIAEARKAIAALTPAERAVALLYVKGFSSREIRDMRGVSEATIDAQRWAILQKMGATNLVQLGYELALGGLE
jgi:DNA-binding NarL/FixJ family response regulator